MFRKTIVLIEKPLEMIAFRNRLQEIGFEVVAVMPENAYETVLKRKPDLLLFHEVLLKDQHLIVYQLENNNYTSQLPQLVIGEFFLLGENILRDFIPLNANTQELLWRINMLLMRFRERQQFMWQKQMITEKDHLFLSQKEQIATLETLLQDESETISEANVRMQILEMQLWESRKYARIVQEGLLPSEERLHQYLNQAFVFFCPKESVGGDFYWLEKKGNFTYLILADCTGHGVAGAMMSIMGIVLLHRIVIYENIQDPTEILNRLRVLFSSIFKNQEKNEIFRIDAAICAINKEKYEVKFAGAKNSLLLIQDGQPFLIKAHRQHISRHNTLPTTDLFTQSFNVSHNDTLYLFSDGFKDQIGKNRTKFGNERLCNLLHEISDLPIHQQKEVLHESFKDWRKDVPQMDDVTVFGFKI